METKKTYLESHEGIIAENNEEYPNNLIVERNIIDSLPLTNKYELGPLTIIATYLNSRFKKRTYTGTFEIPIYGRNSYIIFYGTDSKDFILVLIEKHFTGDVIGLNGTVFFESNRDKFCLNKLELKKNNNEIILTECPWGINISLEKEVSNFKFAPDFIRNFKPQKPPNSWSPITSTIFPYNKIYIELLKLIRTNKSFSNEIPFLDIKNDETPSTLLFLIDSKYMALFLPENYSYFYNKDSFTIFRSDGSYYNILKGLFRNEDGLEMITNAPWNKSLIFDDELPNILSQINNELNSFTFPSIEIRKYNGDSNKKLVKRLSKKIKSACSRLVKN